MYPVRPAVAAFVILISKSWSSYYSMVMQKQIQYVLFASVINNLVCKYRCPLSEGRSDDKIPKKCFYMDKLWKKKIRIMKVKITNCTYLFVCFWSVHLDPCRGKVKLKKKKKSAHFAIFSAILHKSPGESIIQETEYRSTLAANRGSFLVWQLLLRTKKKKGIDRKNSGHITHPASISSSSQPQQASQ